MGPGEGVVVANDPQNNSNQGHVNGKTSTLRADVITTHNGDTQLTHHNLCCDIQCFISYLIYLDVMHLIIMCLVSASHNYIYSWQIQI